MVLTLKRIFCGALLFSARETILDGEFLLDPLKQFTVMKSHCLREWKRAFNPQGLSKLEHAKLFCEVRAGWQNSMVSRGWWCWQSKADHVLGLVGALGAAFLEDICSRFMLIAERGRRIRG